MSGTPTRHAAVILGLMAALIFTACDREASQPPTRPIPYSPLEDLWFRDFMQFFGELHLDLSDESVRAEFRAQLMAGNEAWAWKRLGYTREELGVFFARLELLRPELEARWPELRPGDAREEGGMGDPLIEWLAVADWPSPPDASAKSPDYVCAVYELYENLSYCVSWSPWIQAACMYQAYLRYLQHLAYGCDG